MKKTTEYNIEIETYSGSVLDFRISLTKKELKSLEALVDEKEGSFYLGTYNQVSIEISRFLAAEILDKWAEEDRMSQCTFYYCSDCREYVPHSEPCCNYYAEDDDEDESGLYY